MNAPISLDIPTTDLHHCPHCGGQELLRWGEAADFLIGTSSQLYRYLRCRHCRVLFLATRPVEAALGKLYPEDYSPYGASARKAPVKPASRLAKAWMRMVDGPEKRFRARIHAYYYELPAGSVFLDFGCGAGKMLDRMRERGCQTIGMDFSESALRQVRAKGHCALPAAPSGWDALSDGSLDFVRMNHVLEHLYEPKPVLMQLMRTMRPKARLHIALPNPNGLSASLFGSYWHGLDCPRHVVLYPPRMLMRWLESIGFRAPRLLKEPVYKDFIRSRARAQRRHRGGDARAIDPLMDDRVRRSLATVPVLLASAVGFPDRFHVIVER